jgi:hypothetical protein
MLDPLRSRSLLAARLLAVLGAASFVAQHASCSQAHDGTAGSASSPVMSGAGGAPGAGGSQVGGQVGGGGDAGTDANSGGGSVTSGAGGAGGAALATGGSGGAGGAAAPTLVCLPWPITWAVDGGVPDGGPCPTNQVEVVNIFEAEGCPRGWEPTAIVSGPTTQPPNLCCYETALSVCGPGGRPYLDRGSAQLAPAERGAGAEGWIAGAPPSTGDLTADERASLAAAWTAAALAEHASVASFARVSLELLAAGAPADLLERAHQAALDEIRHARLCFALAGAYAGETMAPGAFPLGGEVRAAASLVDLAVATVEEGCLGETVAAVVAAEQLARATDPAVRAALARIAADEARHAELAWKTVAWAVRTGGSEVGAAVERVLVAAMAGGSLAEVGGAGSARLEAHGLLDGATRARVVAAALTDVVRPAARALLAGGARGSVEASPSLS